MLAISGRLAAFSSGRPHVRTCKHLHGLLFYLVVFVLRGRAMHAPTEKVTFAPVSQPNSFVDPFLASLVGFGSDRKCFAFSSLSKTSTPQSASRLTSLRMTRESFYKIQRLQNSRGGEIVRFWVETDVRQLPLLTPTLFSAIFRFRARQKIAPDTIFSRPFY